MLRYIIFFLLFLPCLPEALQAQPPNSDCASAALICTGQLQVGNNTGAAVLPGICPSTQAMLWYSFTTNSAGGPVNVVLSSIDCPLVPGMDDELSVVVLSGDGTCLPGSFSEVGGCASGNEEVTLTTQALMPATVYWVVVAGMLDGAASSAAQCGFELSFSGPGADIIGVDFSAGDDVTIGEEETVQLEASGGPPYDWSPLSGLSGNSIPNPVASPASSTIYTVTTTIAGCTYSDAVEVRVIRRIEPPNTITPNGDGFNDVWLIPGIVDYPGAEVQIHDRWGQIVYRSTGYREPWDGTNGGRDLPNGTYYYYIRLNQIDGQVPAYTGFISIVR